MPRWHFLIDFCVFISRFLFAFLSSGMLVLMSVLHFRPPVPAEKNLLITDIAEVSFHCQLIIRVVLRGNSEQHVLTRIMKK